MDKNKWSYSYSWSQPYPNWQSWTPPHLDPYNEDMMDHVEEKLKEMSTYPDAENILKKVLNGRG